MDSEFTIWPTELEIETRARGKGRSLRATFPLGKTATIKTSGKVRKETFKAGNGGSSMSWQVREFQKLQGELARVVDSAAEEARREVLIEQLEDALERRNTHLLVGHSYDKAIADMRGGRLALDFSDDAVSIRAALPDPGDAPSWVEDAVRGIKGGQLRGISPGFNVGVKGKERLIPEPGNPSVLVREIEDATRQDPETAAPSLMSTYPTKEGTHQKRRLGTEVPDVRR